MLRKITLALGILALVAGTPLAAATTVVVLDMNRVIETFHKTAKIKKDVEADGKFAEETQKLKVEEFNNLKKDLEAAAKSAEEADNNPTLSQKAKTEARAKLQKLYKEAVEMEQSIRQSQKQTTEFLNNKFTQKTNVVLQEDILPRVKEIAKAHGAEVVLNARVGILYAESSADITKELLERLEKDFPAPAEDEAAAAADTKSSDAADSDVKTTTADDSAADDAKTVKATDSVKTDKADSVKKASK